jgi:hypothetical protein
MEQITSLKLANEVIAKLVSMIEYEYKLADFAHNEYARDSANFDDTKEQRDYLLWSGGQFEVMTRVNKKTDEIFECIIDQLIEGLA